MFPRCSISMCKIFSEYLTILANPSRAALPHPKAILEGISPVSVVFFPPAPLPLTASKGKEKNPNSPVEEPELAGPFKVSHRCLWGSSTSPRVLRVSLSQRGHGAACMEKRCRCVHQAVHTRPRASKAFKHLFTPKLLSNSSGLS